jgi:hypothetical protein
MYQKSSRRGVRLVCGGVREDPPVCCGDWTFDMVISADGETSAIHYYFKEDRMVMVPQTDDSPGKVFSSLQSSKKLYQGPMKK